ncbi:MAG TPA: hypothetical protein VLL52_03485 [Anaerolineae bacterium]|nr:hypothetical protein [Anaerolineae bacterium]
MSWFSWGRVFVAEVPPNKKGDRVVMTPSGMVYQVLMLALLGRDVMYWHGDEGGTAEGEGTRPSAWNLTAASECPDEAGTDKKEPKI